MVLFSAFETALITRLRLGVSVEIVDEGKGAILEETLRAVLCDEVVREKFSDLSGALEAILGLGE